MNAGSKYLSVGIALAAVLAAGCERNASTAPGTSDVDKHDTSPSMSVVPVTIVFGPVDFARAKGKPVTVSSSIPATAGDTLAFYFTSSTSQGLDATISVNGQAMTLTSDSLPHVYQTVAQADNSLLVTLAGKPGSVLRIVASVPKQLELPGLVLYYPFDGNAEDASGNGLNGVAVNAEWVADRAGVPGKAFHVRTNDAWIDTPIPSGSPISFPTSGQFSATLWVRADSLPKGPENGVIFTAGRNSFGWAFEVWPSGILYATVCTPSEYCHSTSENPGG